MAAPHIPNLATFRSARDNNISSGRGRGRRRGRGLPQGIFIPPPSVRQGEEEQDIKIDQAVEKVKIIQSTDQDASISRWSAVQAGYLRDPFAHLFTPSPAPRRFPIINRGAYILSHPFGFPIAAFTPTYTHTSMYPIRSSRITANAEVGLGRKRHVCAHHYYR